MSGAEGEWREAGTLCLGDSDSSASERECWVHDTFLAS